MESQIQEEKGQEKQEVNMVQDKLMDTQAVARRLGVSRSLVYKLIDLGELPSFRMGVQNCIRISESDLIDFLKRRKENAERCPKTRPSHD